MRNKSVLYITYDGITDHIGQSQVAPYLLGLVNKGHRITLLSAEKMERKEIIERYEKIFSENGIEWKFVPYHKKPPVLSSLLDLMNMRKVARKIIKKNKIDLIHCRSYVASLLGLHFKRKLAIPFIFDMRDFWADAGRETKRFDVERNRLHKEVYQFFKKKERNFLEESGHIISLTKAGKSVIERWGKKDMSIKAPITVIPCCGDFTHFDRARLDAYQLEQLRSKLNLQPGDFVLNYLGSLGPAYLTDQLLDLFKVLLEKRPNAKFLIVANNDHQLVYDAALKKGIEKNKLIVTKAQKEEVPYYIALSNLSAFFIMKCFSKKACSPTRLAELFSMGVPVISNSGVGDLDDILNIEINSSTVVKGFTDEDFEAALSKILSLEINAKQIREQSLFLSLEKGVEMYDKVYRSFNCE